jgi:hypothetical protein
MVIEEDVMSSSIPSSVKTDNLSCETEIKKRSSSNNNESNANMFIGDYDEKKSSDNCVSSPSISGGGRGTNSSLSVSGGGGSRTLETGFSESASVTVSVACSSSSSEEGDEMSRSSSSGSTSSNSSRDISKRKEERKDFYSIKFVFCFLNDAFVSSWGEWLYMNFDFEIMYRFIL